MSCATGAYSRDCCRTLRSLLHSCWRRGLVEQEFAYGELHLSFSRNGTNSRSAYTLACSRGRGDKTLSRALEEPQNHNHTPPPLLLFLDDSCVLYNYSGSLSLFIWDFADASTLDSPARLHTYDTHDSGLAVGLYFIGHESNCISSLPNKLCIPRLLFCSTEVDSTRLAVGRFSGWP